MTDMEAAIKELQDAMIVIAHIEKRQSEHSERIVLIEQYHQRTELNLAEITDKLNGLIGFVGGRG